MSVYAPTPEMIEKARRFVLGQPVRVKQHPDLQWTRDWIHTTAIIAGVRFDIHQGAVNVTLLHDGNQLTDEFDPDELEDAGKSVKGGGDVG